MVLQERSAARSRTLEEVERRLTHVPGSALTPQTIAEALAPAIVDWCFVYAHDGKGGLRLVAVANDRASEAEIIWQRHDEHPPRRRHPIARIVRSGESVLCPVIPLSAFADAADGDHEYLTALLGLRMTSAVVALIRRGRRVLGALAFVSTRSRCRFTSSDLAFAERLAGVIAGRMDWIG